MRSATVRLGVHGEAGAPGGWVPGFESGSLDPERCS